MCDICISLKPTSFKCEQILVSHLWEIFGQKSEKLLVFSSKFERFLDLTFSIYFYYQNGCCDKILSQNEENLLIL